MVLREELARLIEAEFDYPTTEFEDGFMHGIAKAAIIIRQENPNGFGDTLPFNQKIN